MVQVFWSQNHPVIFARTYPGCARTGSLSVRFCNFCAFGFTNFHIVDRNLQHVGNPTIVATAATAASGPFPTSSPSPKPGRYSVTLSTDTTSTAALLTYTRRHYPYPVLAVPSAAAPLTAKDRVSLALGLKRI